jgi:hypothetical protein
MNRQQLRYHQVYTNLMRAYRMLKRQLKSRSRYNVLYESSVHMTQLSFRTAGLFYQIAKYDAVVLPSNALDANFAIGVPHVTKAFFYQEYLFE